MSSHQIILLSIATFIGYSLAMPIANEDFGVAIGSANGTKYYLETCYKDPAKFKKSYLDDLTNKSVVSIAVNVFPKASNASEHYGLNVDCAKSPWLVWMATYNNDFYARVTCLHVQGVSWVQVQCQDCKGARTNCPHPMKKPTENGFQTEQKFAENKQIASIKNFDADEEKF